MPAKAYILIETQVGKAPDIVRVLRNLPWFSLRTGFLAPTTSSRFLKGMA